MRDGRGNKLPSDEVDKIRSPQVKPDPESLKTVSIDPRRSETSTEKDKAKIGSPREEPGSGEGPVF